MQPRIFVIEGNIAAGKSTVIKNLKGKFVRVAEPIELWMENGIFQLYNQDPKRYAYSFQTFAFATRVKLFLEAYAQHGPDTTYLLERSWHSDRLFAKANYDVGYFTDVEWKMYNEWCDMYEKLVPFKITGFIYLKTSAQVCYDRLHQRHRTTEELLKLTYLQSLEKSHEEFFATRSHLTVVNDEHSDNLKESAEVSRIDAYIFSNVNEVKECYEKILNLVEAIDSCHDQGASRLTDKSLRSKLLSISELILAKKDHIEEEKDICSLYCYVAYRVVWGKEETYAFVMKRITTLLKQKLPGERCDKLLAKFGSADTTVKTAFIIDILDFLKKLSLTINCDTKNIAQFVVDDLIDSC